jgi:flagellar hook-associated protein 2
MTFGIDGLSSGLDSTSIITQLMQLERQPAVRLEQRTSVNKKGIDALGAIKTALAAVAAAAAKLNDPTRPFVPRVATSSATHVTATAAPTAQLGSLAFKVDALVGTHAVVSSGTVATRDTAVYSGAGPATRNITITTGGTTHTIAVAKNTTLTQLTDQINALGLDVSASMVDSAGGVKLQLTAATSGAAGVFTTNFSTLSAPGLTTTAVLTQGQDAQVTVGTGPGAYAVRSTTNTFTGLSPGLSLTVTAAKPGELVTVTVGENTTALTDNVKAFVDAVNTAFAEIDKHLKYGLDGAKAGDLAGNSTIRALRDRLFAAVTHPVAGSSLQTGGMAGIRSTKTATLEFNATAFADALAADPAAVEALFRSSDALQPGIADRVELRAEEATTANTGIIALEVKAKETQNRGFADSIQRIDRRVELRRATLMRQFSNLEVVLGRMQAQQAWLSSQIGQLNATRSS